MSDRRRDAVSGCTSSALGGMATPRAMRQNVRDPPHLTGSRAPRRAVRLAGSRWPRPEAHARFHHAATPRRVRPAWPFPPNRLGTRRGSHDLRRRAVAGRVLFAVREQFLGRRSTDRDRASASTSILTRPPTRAAGPNPEARRSWCWCDRGAVRSSVHAVGPSPCNVPFWIRSARFGVAPTSKSASHESTVSARPVEPDRTRTRALHRGPC